ncbi:MAG: geranylgeranylglycerol-phosphate geranylgeranyltransferase [Calditrichaeota bacterium]|nr:MAG: geranylgeranylglycerol-phosphate geranylgeranyltransferase [Calditrichota bacterium]
MRADGYLRENLRAVVQLARPVNGLITMASVLVAAVLAGSLEPLEAVALACASAGLINAAGNTINDYFDVEIDRVNKPHRPLPAGRISSRRALLAAGVEFASGNLLAAIISPAMLLFAVFFSALICIYSSHLKRTPLWGNVAVSLTSAAAFIYGGMAVQRPREAVIPALFAFFYHLGREIIKDMEDMTGDRLGNAHTFPVRYGKRKSVALVWGNFLLLVGLTMWPYLTGGYGTTYFIVVVTGIYPVIGYVLFSLLRRTDPDHLNFLSNLLKADMLIGLIALYFR